MRKVVEQAPLSAVQFALAGLEAGMGVDSASQIMVREVNESTYIVQRNHSSFAYLYFTHFLHIYVA